MQTIASTDKEEFLYLQVALRIEQLIDNDVLKIGDKLPSVRSLSREQGISLSTAFQAYYHLENKGLIEPRPKSGYYVKFSRRRLPVKARVNRIKPVVSSVSVSEMISTLQQFSSQPHVIPFARGLVSSELFPVAKLNKSMMHAMRALPDGGTGYENLKGNEALRIQIARQSIVWGGSIDPDDVVITNGCMEALILALKAVAQPGDTVAIESPAYSGVLQAIENMGLKVVELCSCIEDGVYLKELEQCIQNFDIKAFLVVPNFNNPTGSLMPEEHKKALVELLGERNIPIIEDDICGDLYFGRSRPKTCKSFDKKGLVIHCSSFSKTLAPGYRVGWIIPGIFKDKVLAMKLMNTISSATITQAAVAHFLENGRYDHHLKGLRNSLYCNILKYTQAIERYFPVGTKVSCPQGGLVLWIELPNKQDTFKLLEKAIGHNISFSPGKIFSTHRQYNHFMRISCGFTLTPQLEEALRKLGELASEE